MTAKPMTPAVYLFALLLCPPAQAQATTRAAVADQVTARASDSDSLEALENRFWLCEQAARQFLLDHGTAAQCSVVTETLKTQRFGGDFKAMLGWWQANKDARLAQAAGSARPVARPSKGED